VTSFAALIIAAAATSVAGSGDAASSGRGVELASAQVQAQILRPAIVRQASGLQHDGNGPTAQISRRGQTVLVEFQ
jgi:hypothetical protein